VAEHKALTVINKVVLLLTGLETTGNRVEKTRGYPKAVTPAMSVRLATLDPVRELSNTVLDSFEDLETIYHVEGSDLDDQILTIDAEVFAAIMGDRTLTGEALDTDPQALTVESNADKELPSAMAIRRWRFHIRHSSTSATA